jgi:hypothetical protein
VENYIRMLGDERLHNSLQVTFIYVFVSTPLQLAVALAIALLLNEGMKGLPFGLTGFPDAIRRTRRSSSRFRHPGPSRCSPRYADAPLVGAWLIRPADPQQTRPGTSQGSRPAAESPRDLATESRVEPRHRPGPGRSRQPRLAE